MLSSLSSRLTRYSRDWPPRTAPSFFWHWVRKLHSRAVLSMTCWLAMLLLISVVPGVADQRDALLEVALRKIATLEQEVGTLQTQLAECMKTKASVDAGPRTRRQLQDESDPNWNIILGRCNMSDDCLSSPNFPQDYDTDETCVVVISPTWTGHIVAEWWELARQDRLYVDSIIHNPYWHVQDFDGLVPTSSIVWHAANADNDVSKGWKICRTATTTTTTSTTTTTTTATKPMELFFSNFWSVLAGACAVDADGCIGRGQHCAPLLAWSGWFQCNSFCLLGTFSVSERQ